jgi:hypothetical protein
MRSECAKDSRAKLGLARALDWSPQDLQDLPRGVARVRTLKRFPPDLNRRDSQRFKDEQVSWH